MDITALAAQAARIRDAARTEGKGVGAYAQAVELLKAYAGPGSSFLERLEAIDERKKNRDGFAGEMTAAIMEAFCDYLGSGMFVPPVGVTAAQPEEKKEPPPQPQMPAVDCVHELIKRAIKSINTPEVDTSTSIELAGCALDLHLKTEAARTGFKPDKQTNMFMAARALLDAGELSGHDMKNISVWGAMLEDADYGRYDRIADRDRAASMVQGVADMAGRNRKKSGGAEPSANKQA